MKPCRRLHTAEYKPFGCIPLLLCAAKAGKCMANYAKCTEIQAKIDDYFTPNFLDIPAAL